MLFTGINNAFRKIIDTIKIEKQSTQEFQKEEQKQPDRKKSNEYTQTENDLLFGFEFLEDQDTTLFTSSQLRAKNKKKKNNIEQQQEIKEKQKEIYQQEEQEGDEQKQQSILCQFENQFSDYILIYEVNSPDEVINFLTKDDWDKIVKQDSIDGFSQQDLYYSLLYGIKFDIRRKVWLVLAKYKQQKKQAAKNNIFYSNLRSKQSKDIQQIQKDITRTYVDLQETNQKEFQQRLTEVLNAYANYNPQIGYTQGMNFIVAALLIHLNPLNDTELAQEYEIIDTEFTERVFWILVHIMKEKGWEGFFQNNTPSIFPAMQKLDNEMMKEVPDIYQHIQNNGLNTTTLFCQYFFTLMLYNCPQEFGKRILDLFLLQGQEMIYGVIINMCKRCREEILSHHDQDLMIFFRTGILERCNLKFEQEQKLFTGKQQDISDHKFILDTCTLQKFVQ